MSPKVEVKIRRKGDTNVDDVFGEYLINKYGNILKKEYIGITEAETVWINSNIMDFEIKNALYIGTGGFIRTKQGLAFDEHVSTTERDRIQNSSSHLILEKIWKLKPSLENNFYLKKIAKLFQENDLTGKMRWMTIVYFSSILVRSFSFERAVQKLKVLIDALIYNKEPLNIVEEDKEKTRHLILKWLNLRNPNRKFIEEVLWFFDKLNAESSKSKRVDLLQVHKALIKSGEKEIEKIIFELLDLILCKNKKFWRKSVPEAEQKTEIVNIKKRSIAFIKSEDKNISKAVRVRFPFVHLIVHIKENGQILIFPNYKHSLSVDIWKKIAKTVRYTEAFLRGIQVRENDPLLEFGGFIKKVPQWYFQIEGTGKGGKLINNPFRITKIKRSLIKRILTKVLEFGFQFDIVYFMQSSFNQY